MHYYQKEINAFSNYIRLKGYSLQTYKVYMGILHRFLNTLDCHVTDVTQAGFEYYLLQFNNESTQRQIHGCLGNFFKHILHRPDVVKYVPYAKKSQTLPDVYAVEEIQALLNAKTNLKHKLIIALQYDAGLRVSELAALQLRNIDRFRKMIKLEAAKGKKDRYAPVSENVFDLITVYLSEYKPRKFLFEGQHGEQYSPRSIQAVNKAAKAAAGINKKGCTHILRHSFATHLYEQGYGLADISLRLGHANIKTTQIYARLTPEISRKHPTPGCALQLAPKVPVKALRIA